MKSLLGVLLLSISPLALSQSDPTQLHILMGGVVTPGDNTSVDPFMYISVDGPVADSEYAPHLIVSAALTAEPGGAVSQSDISTWKALEFGVGFAQPLSTKLHFDLYGEVGFSTKLPNDSTPLAKTARWAGGGIRFRSEKGILMVGINADQRLNGTYQPAMSLRGAVNLYQAGEKLASAKVMLVGDCVLGLNVPGSDPRFNSHDVIRVGIAVGI